MEAEGRGFEMRKKPPSLALMSRTASTVSSLYPTRSFSSCLVTVGRLTVVRLN